MTRAPFDTSDTSLSFALSHGKHTSARAQARTDVCASSKFQGVRQRTSRSKEQATLGRHVYDVTLVSARKLYVGHLALSVPSATHGVRKG